MGAPKLSVSISAVGGPTAQQQLLCVLRKALFGGSPREEARGPPTEEARGPPTEEARGPPPYLSWDIFFV